MTREAGIDFGRFIDSLKKGRTDVEMAKEFDVSERLIKHLREHFYTHGIGSVVGRD